MRFLFKIILSTSLIPFVLSVAMEKEDQRNKDAPLKEEYKNLRIIITPEMRFKEFPSEDQIVKLQKEAQELDIVGANKMNFSTLSMAVHKAKQEKEAKK